MVRGSNPAEDEIFRAVQTGSEANLASCTTSAESLSRGQSGRDVVLIAHPPSCAEVKKGVELYLYSPSGLHGL